MRVRSTLAAAVLGLLLAVPGAPGAEPARAQPGNCIFQLGFAALRDLINNASGRDIVGQCLENEYHNAIGDGNQRTTGGLLAWRKADNWTAFTNGALTWLNGPCGLQVRPNPEISGQVFAWEGKPGSPCTGELMVAAPPPVAAPPAAPPPAAPPPAAPAAPTATAIPGNPKPTVTISLPEDRPRANEEFGIRLEASDDNGIESMWWWATDTGDQNLRETHTRDCEAATPCRASWNARTDDRGTIILHALARDTNGQLSDEVTRELRVRDPAATPTATATAGGPSVRLEPIAPVRPGGQFALAASVSLPAGATGFCGFDVELPGGGSVEGSVPVSGGRCTFTATVPAGTPPGTASVDVLLVAAGASVRDSAEVEIRP